MNVRQKLIYGTHAALAVGATVLAVSLFPAHEILAAVTGNVALGALVSALFQLMRDEAAHQKELEIQRLDHQLQVGTASHMSNVVYDHVVAFCEAYVTELNATMATLFREHATREAVSHANNLYMLRIKHGAWVTDEMSNALVSFEDALRKLGAKAGFIADTTGHAQYGEQRQEAIDFVYAEFNRIMPQLSNEKPIDGIGILTVVQGVRSMIGVEKLVAIRKGMVEKAHKALDK